jgi:Uma2 family endonuclease
MALEQGRGRMSHADYLSLPEGRYELLEGSLIMTPSPSRRHQAINGTLYMALRAFVQSQNLGWVYIAPLDVTLSVEDPSTVVQPDLLFVARAHAARLTESGVQGPPDLIVEIVSPGSIRLDAVKKRALYDRHGVPEYWLVLPEQDQVEIFCRARGGFARPQLLEANDVLTTPLLPGFELTLRQVFEAEG